MDHQHTFTLIDSEQIIICIIYIDFDFPTNNFNIIYKTLGMSTM